MFNISDKTALIGYSGKRSTLQQALADKNLHRNLQHTYWGPRAARGTVEVNIRGEWLKIRFHEVSCWAKRIEVI